MRWTATDLDGRDFEKSHAAGSDKETVTPTIHLTLQGKGGVGKAWLPASSPNISVIAARKSIASIPIP
jgi:hypothetical protein